ncbi:MAG: SNF2-related protein [Bacillota bacterium]
MANSKAKYDEIHELVASAFDEVTGDKNEWMKFLKSSCRNYKCDFNEKLLIYSQKPHATAVLTYDEWKENFGRQVKRGAWGIAVIDKAETSSKYAYKYLFDISDTYEKNNSIPVPIWSREEDDNKAITSYIEFEFGTEGRTDNSIESVIRKAIDVSVDIEYADLPDNDLNQRIKNVIKESVEVTVFERLDIPLVDEYTFDGLEMFNADEIEEVAQLQNEMSEFLLTGIGKTIQLERNKEKSNERNNIQRSERDNDTQPHKQQQSRVQHREVRSDEESIHGREQESNATKRDEERDIAEISAISQSTSDSDVGNVDSTNERAREDNRRDEGSRQSSMDERDEQHNGESGRSSSHGSSLSIDRSNELEVKEDSADIFTPQDNIPLEVKQLSFLEAVGFGAVEKDIYELFPNSELDVILQRGSGTEGGKLRIREAFATLGTKKELVEFVKKEYNYIGFSPMPVGNKRSVGINASPKGLELYYYEESGAKTTGDMYPVREYIGEIMPWNKITPRIKHLIEHDNYLDDNELQKYIEQYVFPIPVKEHQELEENIGVSALSNQSDEQFSTLCTRDVLEEIFYMSSGYSDTKQRIYTFFQRNLSNEANEEFLQFEYGEMEEPFEVYSEEGATYYESYNSQGYTIEKVHSNGDTEKELIGWNKISEFINQLIKEDKLLSEEEKEDCEKNKQEWDNRINDYIESHYKGEENLRVDSNIDKLSDYSNYIGATFAYENRMYMLEEVKNYQASLRDITFQEGTGFPIWRSEPVGWAIEKIDRARELLKKQELANVKNFEITDDELGEGTPRERYRNNIAAIKVVQTCENENRTATAEEQEILSKYVGWGGLSEAFDQTKWGNEYVELKELLSDEEYSLARASTLTAFYTPPVVIKSMYQSLVDMGLEKGNILEPSCGVGNFIGSKPKSLDKANFYGVELDDLSGRIAKLLYPKSKIQITGFEKATLADNFFDVAIGNVPFGDFKVVDSKYDKQNFQIHDYFFAKALDKVRPSGVIAFITSQGTLDKTSEKFRAYINERAEFLGAIRLPDDTFKSAAGTRVTSDIIFLQKRERQNLADADWIHLGVDQNDIEINSYYAQNPHMIMGTMRMETGPYGMQANCKPIEGASLEKQLEKAIKYIKGEIKPVIAVEGEDVVETIPADPSVRNHSYTIINGEVFFRQNSEMIKSNLPKMTQERIKGMVEIRRVMRDLINYQIEERSDESIDNKQRELNDSYDKFVKKYGFISLKANESAFFEDSSYYLIASLEKKDSQDEKLFHKAAMFTERTIKAKKLATSVETSVEALTLSMAEKARVDLQYMSQLVGRPKEEIVKEFEGVIFLVPSNSEHEVYQTADEYLSGNVRVKLSYAKYFASMDDKYKINVEALTKAIPKDLEASEISVRAGATWIEPKYYKEFIFDLLSTGYYGRNAIDVNYYPTTGEWKVPNASSDSGNVLATSTYGTSRMNAYKIFENTLNLRDVKIFDTVYDADNNKKQVLNAKETDIARDKQSAIKEKFIDWIFRDAKRREYLVNKYNEEYNALKLREYNGDQLNFIGMSDDISLRKHQKDAVAHILYGGNTLLAHVVGAGKTFEMIAAAQESKRLGLCNKSMFVVPNHLIDQWATDYMKLYPTANILVTTKKDFETKNRKKFTGKIATGEYDAIIIGHSQFEKIPMSIERRERELSNQIEEVIQGIIELKGNRGERASIKALERTKRKLEERLEKLNSQTRKDDVINFEELGVDKLFVDEAHNYKNLFLFTKMTNVGGIAQTEAMKSSDLYMKCRFLDEITNGRGVVFATGTPISNSMVEMYTMQRYLQSARLRELNLSHFDSWAANFGETVSAIELAPEGTGYRTKTRFSKFFNLPELMTTFREIADIKTADMLELPVPKAIYHNVSVEATEIQKREIEALAERADAVRNREVDSTEDNLLKITNDGRKLALDARLLNPEFPDSDGTKVNACVENVFKIWQEGTGPNSIHGIENTTQLIFSDLSTPKSDGSFNVYDDVKNKLIEKGIPKEEIAFIHETKTDKQKDALFEKVRNGKIRILLGSTAKMGAGTNVQDRLVAIHDLDCPWRPSDLEQRAGRIIRQGNRNIEVHIFRYVTKDTFDAYSYQIIEGKQRFISQVMTSKSIARSADDIDEASLTYAEIKMLATGNPFIKEKMDLDIKINKLRVLKNNHMNEVFRLQDFILKEYPQTHAMNASIYERITLDLEHYKTLDKEADFSITIGKTVYTEKEQAREAFMDATRTCMRAREAVEIGRYKGFKLLCEYQAMKNTIDVLVKGNHTYRFERGTSDSGNLTRLDNAIDKIPELKEVSRVKLEELENKLSTAKLAVDKPFDKQEEFEQSLVRLKEVEALINVENKPKGQFTKEQLDEIEAGKRAGLDISVYSDSQFNAEQMREIRLGLETGIDVSIYADKKHDISFMSSIREALERELMNRQNTQMYAKKCSLSI